MPAIAAAALIFKSCEFVPVVVKVLGMMDGHNNTLEVLATFTSNKIKHHSSPIPPKFQSSKIHLLFKSDRIRFAKDLNLGAHVIEYEVLQGEVTSLDLVRVLFDYASVFSARENVEPKGILVIELLAHQ
jgi:hypothetical protein